MERKSPKFRDRTKCRFCRLGMGEIDYKDVQTLTKLAKASVHSQARHILQDERPGANAPSESEHFEDEFVPLVIDTRSSAPGAKGRKALARRTTCQERQLARSKTCRLQEHFRSYASDVVDDNVGLGVVEPIRMCRGSVPFNGSSNAKSGTTKPDAKAPSSGKEIDC